MATIDISYSGHSPSISVDMTYDTATRKVTIKWTCGPGYFRYSYFEFYVYMQYKKGKGDWPKKKKKIGGMRNPEGTYNDLWATKTEQTITATLPESFVKNQTYIALGIDCSATSDGGNCYSGFNGPTRATDWEKITTTSKTPKVSLQAGYEYSGNKRVCTLINSLPIYWSVTGDGVVKCAMQIQEVWGSNDAANVSWVYSTSAPKKYENAVKFDNITITQCMHNGTLQALLPCQWYDVTVAVGTSSEKMDDQWEDDAKTLRVRTREESPNAYFSLSGAATTQAIINWSTTFPTRGTGAPMYSLGYSLHDDTTNTDVTTTGVAAAADDSREASWGQFVISGLTIGHTYTITPNSGSTQLDRVGVGLCYGCTFISVLNPTLDAVWNMDDWSLVFGEGSFAQPKVIVRVGTAPADTWNITAYLGIIAANGQLSWFKSQAVVVGDNEILLSDDDLDFVYKNINPTYSTYGFTLYVQINYNLPDGTLPGYDAKQYTMWFRGNMKVAHAGINATPTPRAKIWVGTGDGSAHRAICWVGVGGVPRRTI
ncbi:MAG TPA: hypothetical protein DCW90_12715 [Lachnospiraceae bacterium]|nr:hypothetical protein [Lachnospiraceae bacterium]